ncbi:MAG TPA: hypothetical protein VLR94_02540 [Acidobacteriota bacterium]|nr:hypothetical protein [Acidobacteriota bacterium]
MDTATGAFDSSAYSGEWYEFRPDGTYEHIFIGSGQIISGASITTGVYEASANRLVLHQKKASWYRMPKSAKRHSRYKDRPDVQELVLEIGFDSRGALLVRDATGTATFHRQPAK